MKKILKKGLSILMSTTILMSSGVMATSVSAADDTSITNYSAGDVNGDRKINIDDLNTLQDYLYGDYKPSDIDRFLKAANINGKDGVDDEDVEAFIDGFIYADAHKGDVDNDSKVNIVDTSMLQKYIAGFETPMNNISSILAADTDNDGSISVNDATAIQRDIAGYPKAPSFPTQAVKDADAKYRKEYAEYITPTIEAVAKNCYLVESDNPSHSTYFRDSKWLYRYVSDPGTIYPERRGLKVVGTYISDKNMVLPSKTDGGVSVGGVGFASGSVIENAGAKMFYDAGDLSLAGYHGSYGPGIELNSVIIPNNYVIEGYAFTKNMTLKHVFMASNVTLYNYCFSDCPSLVSVKLSNTLEKIPNNAFQGCRSLNRVAIPDNVKNIGSGAFIDCALKEIILNKNVVSIGKNAFLDCPLEKVYVYNPVADIGATAFINRSYGYNSNINPNCKFYGYKNSTLEDWLKGMQELVTAWGDTMTYNFITL